MSSIQRIRGDFNGLFGSLLCLSHSEVAKDENWQEVELSEGMLIEAFDEDTDDEGNRDDLIARGVVVPSPDWLQCRGSRWALQIDEQGVIRESERATGT